MRERARVSVCTTLAELEGLRGPWRSLREACPSAAVFQGPEWHIAWWRAVGQHREECALRVVVVREGERLAGVLPLMLDASGVTPVLRFLSWPFADYHDLLLARPEPALARNLWAGALDAAAPGCAVDLAEVRPGSLTARVLKPVIDEGQRTVADAPDSECVRLDLTDDGHLRRVIERKEYVRKTRALERMGALRLDHLTDGAAIDREMAAFQAQHTRQWQARQRATVAGFDDPEVSRFFRQLPAELDEEGGASLVRLRLDDQPIAYYFGFRDGDAYRAYRPSFAIELAKHSPGWVLLTRLLPSLRQAGYRTFDLMRGAYAYKQDLCSRQSRNLRLTVAQSPLDAGLPAPRTTAASGSAA